MSLRARLATGTVALLAFAIAAGFFAAYFVVRNELNAQVDASLRGRAASIAILSRRIPSRLGKPRLPRVTPVPLGGLAGYIQFVKATGKTSLTPGERVKLPTAGAQAVARGQRGAFFRDVHVGGTHLRIYTTSAGPGTAVQVARSLGDVDHALGWIRLLFVAISAIAIGASAALALLVARATLRPVDRLTADVERIAATRDLRAGTDESRSDELGRLARAFNTMLRALGDSLTAQRQLVADASHELRTPLTTARTSLESLQLHPEMPAADQERNVAVAIDELSEMTRLIEELVELARGDARSSEQRPTRLDLVAAEAIAVAERRSGREIRAELRPSTVLGAPDDLARAISNLLDNAIKWSPPGEAIEVSVSEGTCRVRDHGPGVDTADIPHVFDRFYRAAAARTLPGSGLGLAIVRQVAEGHAGTATAERAEDGGSIFTIRLPPFAGNLGVPPGAIPPTLAGTDTPSASAELSSAP
jgi:two-component system sensor histidine kinase MprB